VNAPLVTDTRSSNRKEGARDKVANPRKAGTSARRKRRFLYGSIL